MGCVACLFDRMVWVYGFGGLWVALFVCASVRLAMVWLLSCLAFTWCRFACYV